MTVGDPGPVLFCLLSQAQAIVDQGWLKAGYDTLILDAGWSRDGAGTMLGPGGRHHVDSFGRNVPDPKKWPSGFKNEPGFQNRTIAFPK